ncbi:MAG: hypothetical protein CW338_02170 [Clostridiales bacterium]|nr:hypothetical protein [Clostridiales bacterium]
MKKIICSLLILVLAAALALGLSAAAEDSVTGLWNANDFLCKIYGASEDDLKALYGDFSYTMEFTADGKLIATLTAYGYPDSTESEYYTEGSTLYINGEPSVWEIRDGNLIISSEGIEITLIPMDGETSPAADPSAVIGLWDADDYVCQGYGMSPDDLAAGGISCTMEFTADNALIISIQMGDYADVMEQAYAVDGDTLYINGEPNSWYIENGDLVFGSYGMFITLHPLTAAEAPAPAAEEPAGLTGLWNANDFLCKMYGTTEDAIRAIYGDFSYTMEFTADGKLIATLTAYGYPDSTESEYYTEGSTLYINGEPSAWEIRNGNLIISSEGIEITLIPMDGEAVPPAEEPVPAEEPAPAEEPVPAEDGFIPARWNAIDYLCKRMGMDEATLLARYSDLTFTMEFTADGKLLMVQASGGRESVQEQTWSVDGGTLYINNIAGTWEMEDGNLIIGMGGITFTLLPMDSEAEPEAPAPAPAPSVEGKWAYDTDAIIAVIAAQKGISADEAKAAFTVSEGILEFTADGRVILTVSTPDGTRTEEKEYTADGDTLVTDGAVTCWRIEDGRLILTEGETTLILKPYEGE